VSSVQCSVYNISGFGFRVSGFGFRVSGFGFRVSGFGCENLNGREEGGELVLVALRVANSVHEHPLQVQPCIIQGIFNLNGFGSLFVRSNWTKVD